MIHPATEHLLSMFNYAHLPKDLQTVAAPIADLDERVGERGGGGRGC